MHYQKALKSSLSLRKRHHKKMILLSKAQPRDLEDPATSLELKSDSVDVASGTSELDCVDINSQMKVAEELFISGDLDVSLTREHVRNSGMDVLQPIDYFSPPRTVQH